GAQDTTATQHQEGSSSSQQSGASANTSEGGQRSERREGRSAFDEVVTVAVATVTTADVPQYINAVGTVIARNTATVRARVSGQLDKVLFKEGQLVKAGDVLAVIDPRPYQVVLDQQIAQLQRDLAQLGNAKHDLERYQGLVADKVISQQQVDTQAALVKQYDGVVAIDRAQAASARLNVNYTNITAPVSGRTGLRQVDPGNLVSSTDVNGIVVITQIKPINVVFAVPGDRISDIAKQLNIGSRLPVDALDRDGKTRIASGTLLTADNQIDPTTGTVKLKAEFANDDAALFPNQFVNVRLQLALNKGATIVPSTAIQQGKNGNYVYVVKPDSTVTMRPISINTTTASSTIVTQGLNVDEQVVVDGLDKLRDGKRVRVSSTADAQAAANGQGAEHGWQKSQGAPGDPSRPHRHKQPAAQ
ncbi:MAG: MdtA/MuxA family multidrug efflux RND transporter periplasmic adaptor subunit, partial [Steroidobacter sp.]